ncbi:hypothetical protein J6524_04895 [Bradyrhizobium sp. WSM 1738]|uniref:hypothetical protein n=1 Tax=Bradyrhizobium hereditatis TaxID=2821405 RepID=UPI001CE385F0|nr:hypothetical protein [Bradyrhizobium hereditatis]MCA6114266.1 hypothetical protein [Bradyrhizobium hereditatis]
MIFPLWKFWTYSPLGFAAAVVWNVSELLGFPCPFAPTMFDWIMGAKPVRVHQQQK